MHTISKKSFSRNFRKHLSLYVILTCAFLLPLVISIYRDSAAYGTSQSLLFLSKGQTFHIQDVTRGDCQYFQGISGLSTPFFEENTIYLKILNDEEWKDSEKMGAYDCLLQERVKAAGRSIADIIAFDFFTAHGISTDPKARSDQRSLLILNIILIVFTSLIIQSSYRSHLLHFSADMKTLSCCGADQGQICAIFETEFLAVYIASSISALLISAVVMKTLFWLFLEIKKVPNLRWLVFHIDIKNTAIHLLIYFLSLGTVLIYSLKQFHSGNSFSSISIAPKKIRKKKIKINGSPALSLAMLWRQRTNKVFRSCLYISIPFAFIALFLFHYLLLDIAYVTEPPEYAFVISNYAQDFHGFGADDISFVEGLEDVLCVETGKGDFQNEYLLETSDGMFFPARPRSLDKLKIATNVRNQYEVAVSKYCSIRENHCGDTLRLHKIGDSGSEYNAVDGHSDSEEPMYELVIADILNVPTGDWSIDIYMNEALFLEITSHLPIRELKIKLKNVDNHQLVEAALQGRFPEAAYRITNNQAPVDAAQKGSNGIYLLLAYIFAIMVLLVQLILYTRLCDYVNESFHIIKALYIIGAEKRNLYQSFMLQAAVPAFISALVPEIVSLSLSWYVARSLDMTLPMDGIIALVYIVAAMLAAAAYLCPIHFTLRKYISIL